MKAVELWKTARPLFERSSQMKDIAWIDAKLAEADSAVFIEYEEKLQRLSELHVSVSGPEEIYIGQDEEEDKLAQGSNVGDEERQGLLLWPFFRQLHTHLFLVDSDLASNNYQYPPHNLLFLLKARITGRIIPLLIQLPPARFQPVHESELVDVQEYRLVCTIDKLASMVQTVTGLPSSKVVKIGLILTEGAWIQSILESGTLESAQNRQRSTLTMKDLLHIEMYMIH
ncbi:hypothetical protein C8J57DRAFT_1249067 [Mycena rebaudengoi]|nr:hypothetical protein C8J57DRAFT_1249067 [Mycena rebaudengoi]